MKNHKIITPYIVAVILVILLCFLCSRFCFQLMLLQGESMEPSYKSGQLLFINKLDREYDRGDCVLIDSDALGRYVFKRIVALPGDDVHILFGTLYVNGEAVLPYPGCPEIEDAGLAAEKLTVPEGCCFVLGDNFSRSIDSRSAELGFVEIKNIIGKAK